MVRRVLIQSNSSCVIDGITLPTINGSYVLTSKIIFSDEVYSFACRSVATDRFTSVGLPSTVRS